ncbi:hypothetical protein [Streptomyces hawaiiensis]|nr:hypothetical protein [Streptomyces hawaiiensis]
MHRPAHDEPPALSASGRGEQLPPVGEPHGRVPGGGPHSPDTRTLSGHH